MKGVDKIVETPISFTFIIIDSESFWYTVWNKHMNFKKYPYLFGFQVLTYYLVRHVDL